MTLSAQTAPFPPIHQPEQSWEQNIRAALDLLAPGAGVRSGFKLGVPLASDVPTTGLTPSLTDGHLVKGDQVLGPYGSKLIGAAPASATRNLYFGLQGLYYGTEPATPQDVLVGSLVTDADSVVHVAQPMNYGAGRLGIRGQVNLEKVTDGADQTAFTLVLPATGLDNVRVSYAEARVIAAVTGGNDAGDDFVLKIAADGGSAVTLATIAHSAIVTLNATSRFAAADGDAVSWHGASNLAVLYNQTDGSTAIAGGLVEFTVLLELF
jgi:hypothetical protein